MPFTMIDFSSHPTVVYQESLSGALFLDKAYHVETHGLAFDLLRATTLSPADSLTYMRARAEGNTRSKERGRAPMTTRDLVHATWRKSTRSNGQGACVEVATNVPNLVLVRDSKDRTGSTLGFYPLGWAAFVTSLTTNEVA